MSDLDVIVGCEPFSHVGSSTTGVLVVHGFTGNPSSMRYQAHAFAAAGHHVEQPLLPGHGTTLADMQATDWSDWSAAVAEAYDQLAERSDEIVVIGLSMGGTLTLWTGLHRLGDERLRGLICINPATLPQPADVIEMVEGLLADGVDASPSIGGDIADPDQVEIAYDATPLRPFVSLNRDGLVPIADRYGELRVPLLIFSAPDDHVVPSEHSEHLRTTAGDDVEFVTLTRSFHVATQDFDRDLINERSLAFIERVTR
jgi:carboxylesterase